MVFLGYYTGMCYAVAYDNGYPPLPLIALGVCFSLYVKLRPSNAPSSVSYATVTADPILILILAAIASVYLLHWRGEEPFSPGWVLHLSALTFFALLIPFIITYPFPTRAKTAVATVTGLLLVVLFWQGTEFHDRAKVERARRLVEGVDSLDQRL